MTEQGRQISEIEFSPYVERLKMIDGFSKNFRAFLDEKGNNITLAQVPFVEDIRKLIVSNFINKIPAPFAYENLDQDFLKTIERFRKSNTTPTAINEKFKLERFKEMPENLIPLIGKEIKVTSLIYDLVSMGDEKASVSQVRYFASPSDSMPIYESWTAERHKTETEDLKNSSKPGFELQIPKIHHLLTSGKT